MRTCAIVLNYRNAARTEACLRSLLGEALTMALVVDNSADQRSAQALAEAMRRLQEAGGDFPLKLLSPDSNLGFARGVNLALNCEPASDCDAFLLLNNDATAVQGMVAKLAAALSSTNFDLVVPTVIDDNNNPQPEFWYQRFFGLLASHRMLFSFPYPSGCCLLLRRELLTAGKLLDEDFFMYGEDTLLGWRLARAGKGFCRVNDAAVRHTSGASSRQGQLFYEYHTARAHVLLALKTWHSPLEIPLLLATKSIGLALRALRRSVRCGSGVPLLAFVLAWFPVKLRAP